MRRGRVPHTHPRTRRAAHAHVRIESHARYAPGLSPTFEGQSEKCDLWCARRVDMRVPCKAARGVRILGRPRTFRRPKYRPSPRGPTGESNPTASSHTGDGAPARASLRVASVHTQCAWRRGGDYRATRERAVRVLGMWNRAPDTRSAGLSKNGGQEGDDLRILCNEWRPSNLRATKPNCMSTTSPLFGARRMCCETRPGEGLPAVASVGVKV